MVRIPIGKGSKKVTVMVVCAYPGRGKEANTHDQQIFDTVIGPAAGLGDTPTDDLSCSTSREDSRDTWTSRSVKDGSRTWDRRTSLLEQHNSCIPMNKEIRKRAWILHL